MRRVSRHCLFLCIWIDSGETQPRPRIGSKRLIQFSAMFLSPLGPMCPSPTPILRGPPTHLPPITAIWTRPVAPWQHSARWIIHCEQMTAQVAMRSWPCCPCCYSAYSSGLSGPDAHPALGTWVCEASAVAEGETPEPNHPPTCNNGLVLGRSLRMVAPTPSQCGEKCTITAPTK